MDEQTTSEVTSAKLHLLELAKVQVEGEKGKCQCYAHTGQASHRVEGDGCDGGIPKLEDPLRYGNLTALPLYIVTLPTLEVQML